MGGGGGSEGCPPGQTWCPGCTPGTGQCGETCVGLVCPVCAEIATLEECEASPYCHSVFEDPGTCGCATIGCCAHFARCADGDKADCVGASVDCEAMTPFCESPAYVVSAAGTCYEGCVDPKDCAAVCTAPDDGSNCYCYSDADCTGGARCYAEDCATETPGTCRVPPVGGCFGDIDCPTGEACVGGRPSPCNTTIPETIGTCTPVACPEGDCGGSAGPDCTCFDGAGCVAATGPTGSGQCREPDGNCWSCKCAAPDTPIATPSGERALAELRPGDLVFSVDGEQIRAVPVLRINRTPVVNHRVLHVTFENGRSIDMTAEHPLADGRPLSALQPGSELLGGTVLRLHSVPYRHAATYDILPDSTSGAYFASGVLVGSTLKALPADAAASCR